MARETFISKDFGPERIAIIAQANVILSQYAAQGYDLSLRQLYYQFVARDLLPNSQRSYSRLGDIISEARLAGLVDWDMIKDRGRQTIWYAHWADPADRIDQAARTYQIDKWEDQPAYVEVMVEKQALEGVLIPVCTELDIRFTANKGYSSSSAMYEASKRFLAAEDEGKDCYVLYLGDHDPSGIDMTRDIDDRLALFTDQSPNLQVQRLALNFDQVTEYNPPENPAKTTDSRSGGYIAEYGTSSWELDALEPTVLADLVRDAVYSIRDEEVWNAAVLKQEKGREELKAYAKAYRTSRSS